MEEQKFWEIDYEGQHIGAIVGYITIICTIINDLHDRFIVFMISGYKNPINPILCVISVYTTLLMIPVSFRVSAEGDSISS